MICKNCGKILNDNDRFCSYCGTKTGYEPEEDFVFTAPERDFEWDVHAFPDGSTRKTDDTVFDWEIEEGEFRNRPSDAGTETVEKTPAEEKAEPVFAGVEMMQEIHAEVCDIPPFEQEAVKEEPHEENAEVRDIPSFEDVAVSDMPAEEKAQTDKAEVREMPSFEDVAVSEVPAEEKVRTEKAEIQDMPVFEEVSSGEAIEKAENEESAELPPADEKTINNVDLEPAADIEQQGQKPKKKKGFFARFAKDKNSTLEQPAITDEQIEQARAEAQEKTAAGAQAAEEAQAAVNDQAADQLHEQEPVVIEPVFADPTALTEEKSGTQEHIAEEAAVSQLNEIGDAATAENRMTGEAAVPQLNEIGDIAGSEEINIPEETIIPGTAEMSEAKEAIDLSDDRMMFGNGAEETKEAETGSVPKAAESEEGGEESFKPHHIEFDWSQPVDDPKKDPEETKEDLQTESGTEQKSEQAPQTKAADNMTHSAPDINWAMTMDPHQEFLAVMERQNQSEKPAVQPESSSSSAQMQDQINVAADDVDKEVAEIFEDSFPEGETSAMAGMNELKEEHDDDITGKELERELFGGAAVTGVVDGGEGLSRQSAQIDKFYKFNKKNEEFQKLLDNEYEKFREGRPMDEDTFNANVEAIKAGKTDQFTIQKGDTIGLRQMEEINEAIKSAPMAERKTMPYKVVDGSEKVSDIKENLSDEETGSKPENDASKLSDTREYDASGFVVVEGPASETEEKEPQISPEAVGAVSLAGAIGAASSAAEAAAPVVEAAAPVVEAAAPATEAAAPVVETEAPAVDSASQVIGAAQPIAEEYEYTEEELQNIEKIREIFGLEDNADNANNADDSGEAGDNEEIADAGALGAAGLGAAGLGAAAVGAAEPVNAGLGAAEPGTAGSAEAQNAHASEDAHHGGTADQPEAKDADSDKMSKKEKKKEKAKEKERAKEKKKQEAEEKKKEKAEEKEKAKEKKKDEGGLAGKIVIVILSIILALLLAALGIKIFAPDSSLAYKIDDAADSVIQLFTGEVHDEYVGVIAYGPDLGNGKTHRIDL